MAAASFSTPEAQSGTARSPSTQPELAAASFWSAARSLWAILSRLKTLPPSAKDLTALWRDVNPSYSLIGSNANSGLAAAPVGAPDANGNLIGGPAGPFIDPLLGPLVDNGGSTKTHALLVGSPAIDAGNPAAVAGAGGVPATDQRGEAPFGRVFGGRIDMGRRVAADTPSHLRGLRPERPRRRRRLHHGANARQHVHRTAVPTATATASSINQITACGERNSARLCRHQQRPAGQPHCWSTPSPSRRWSSYG